MRVFVALEVPAPVNARLDQALSRLIPRCPPARWVPAANRHLTLVFLGAVRDAVIERLNESLLDVFASEAPLELQPRGSGAFPADKPARVVWMGFRPTDALRRLQERTAEACRSLGFTIDTRPFVPHLTLARCRRPWPPAASEAWRGAWREASTEMGQDTSFGADRGCLFESTQSPRGVRYRVVRSYPLGWGSSESSAEPRIGQ